MQAAAGLLQATRAAAFPVTVLFFSIGSLIFFILFLRARFIPLWLAWSGVIGSAFAAVLAVTSLLVASPPAWLSQLWIPPVVAEIAGGLLLLLRGADLRYWFCNTSRQSDAGAEACSRRE